MLAMCVRARMAGAISEKFASAQTLAAAPPILARPKGENMMLIRSTIASAVLAAVTVGCTPSPQAPKAAINDKTYAVAPGEITVKGSLLSGALTEIKVVERVEEGSGRIDTPARLTGKLHLVEGETDALTLWYHGFPALGLPGSNTGKTLRAECLDCVDAVGHV